MKKGMLICTGSGKVKNIGDYIQSLVAEVFFDSIDVLVEREKLSEYKPSQKTLLLMNAWYMWQPENWPPSDGIIPHLTSIHLNFSAKKKMLEGAGYDYFKKYEPIGCRDLLTLDAFKEKGIDAYFSGCLTLALGEKYKTNNRTGKVYFIDPYYECISGNRKISLKNILTPFFYGVLNYKKIKPLYSVFKYHTKLSFLEPYLSRIEKFLHISAFYRIYSKRFDNEVLYNAIYKTHIISQKEFKSEDEKLEYARELLKKYSSAKLVVTSRIHAALPAIGMDTPTIFVTSDFLNNSKDLGRNGGRFEGLIEFFNILNYKNNNLYSDNSLPEKIKRDSVIVNNNKHISVKDKLIKSCYEFVEKNKIT